MQLKHFWNTNFAISDTCTNYRFQGSCTVGFLNILCVCNSAPRWKTSVSIGNWFWKSITKYGIYWQMQFWKLKFILILCSSCRTPDILWRIPSNPDKLPEGQGIQQPWRLRWRPQSIWQRWQRHHKLCWITPCPHKSW